MKTQIRRKNWIGHRLRKAHSNVTVQAFFSNPQGKQNRGTAVGHKTIREDYPNKNCSKYACDRPKLNDKLRTGAVEENFG